MAPKTLIAVQYRIARTMPAPMPYIAPCLPVVTANGTAISAMMSVTNGNASLRCIATTYGTTLKPPASSDVT